MKKHRYHGFLRKYKNVYLYIAVLVFCGSLMGLFLSSFINLSDIQQLSSFLTTIDAGVEKYDYFISQFFLGILFILFVFLLGTSFIGIPLISLVIFTKGVQIGFSCALFILTYEWKGILGILLALIPQVLFDLMFTFLIAASAIQLSMYIIYSTTNRERLDYKRLLNSILNDIFLCFGIVLIGSYLKSTIGIECIRLFNLL